jgi:hypothetical protein
MRYWSRAGPEGAACRGQFTLVDAEMVMVLASDLWRMRCCTTMMLARFAQQRGSVDDSASVTIPSSPSGRNTLSTWRWIVHVGTDVPALQRGGEPEAGPRVALGQGIQLGVDRDEREHASHAGDTDRSSPA